MLPPLGALSLGAREDVPTGVRDANPTVRRGPGLLDSILRSTSAVHKRAARAHAGGRRPDYEADAPPPPILDRDSNVCPDCPPGQNENVSIDRYDHVKRCDNCGLELGKFGSEKAERRNFADDAADHTRTVEDNSDEVNRLNHLEPHELGMTSEADEGFWMAQTRLQQCFVWLDLMGDNPLTRDAGWWLNTWEIRRAKSMVRHATIQWTINGRPGGSNPVLWAIIVALQVCAERFGAEGFVVPADRPDLQQLLTIEGLHAFLAAQRSVTHQTQEVQGAATAVRGANRAAQRMIAQEKYRSARFDSLNMNGLMGRVGNLNDFLKQSGVLPEGLSPVITGLNRPALQGAGAD